MNFASLREFEIIPPLGSLAPRPKSWRTPKTITQEQSDWQYISSNKTPEKG